MSKKKSNNSNKEKVNSTRKNKSDISENEHLNEEKNLLVLRNKSILKKINF